MNKKNVIITIAVALIVGGASFYGGMTYANSKNPPRNFNRAGGNFQQGRAGGANRMGSGLANGEVLKKDDKSLTIKLQDGGSKNVYISASTTVSKFVEGSMNDIAVGENIMINGTTNSDGSVMAQFVQIRPKNPNPAATSTPGNK